MPVNQCQTAGALLFDADGRALLGRRSAHKRVAPRCWDIIGGHVEPKETVVQALLREVREELGIHPTDYTNILSLQEPLTAVTHHVFAVTAWTGGIPSNASDEHDEIAWFSLAEIERLENRTPFDFADLFHRASRTSRQSN